MGTWGHEDMGTWGHEDMGTWGNGDKRTWGHGAMGEKRKIKKLKRIKSRKKNFEF